MTSGEKGRKLADLIKKAIHDLELTTSEYEEILALAAEDHHLDAQEKALLGQLHELLANNTIRKIPG